MSNSALDQAFSQFRTNLSNTASDVGNKITRLSSPVTNFVKQATTTLTNNATDAVAQIPFRSLNYRINNIQQKGTPLDFNRLQKEGRLLSNKLESTPKPYQNFTEQQFWPEDQITKNTSASKNLMPYDKIKVKTNPYLEGFKQKVIKNMNLKPAAQQYLSKIPVTYVNDKGPFAGRAINTQQPNAQININEKYYPNPIPVSSTGATLADTPEIKQQLESIIQHELLHQAPDFVSTTQYKPVDKKQVDSYIKRWGEPYFTNPDTGQIDTNRLVGEMFAEKDLPPIYYWHIFKQTVPGAKPSDFINAIKQVFLTQYGR